MSLFVLGKFLHLIFPLFYLRLISRYKNSSEYNRALPQIQTSTHLQQAALPRIQTPSTHLPEYYQQEALPQIQTHLPEYYQQQTLPQIQTHTPEYYQQTLTKKTTHASPLHTPYKKPYPQQNELINHLEQLKALTKQVKNPVEILNEKPQQSTSPPQISRGFELLSEYEDITPPQVYQVQDNTFTNHSTTIGDTSNNRITTIKTQLGIEYE